jgi:hypothetical protein
MTARLMVGVLAVASMALVGCGSKEGQRVVEFNRAGNRIQEKKANEAGRYTLHAPGHPEVTFHVVKGERVGFRKASGDVVEAYAGDNPAVELDHQAARGAYWEFDKKALK